MKKEIKATIDDIAEDSYKYMSTDYGKDRILNPGDGHKAIIKVSWTSTQFGDKVAERVEQYVEKHLKSDDVRKKFTEIQEEIATFYKHVCQEVSYMENDWTNVQNDGDKRGVHVNNDDDEISTGSVVGVVVATSPLWVPLMAAGFGLVVAFAGLTVALSPVLLSLNAILGRDKRKQEIIDEEYEKCKRTIRSTIYNHLDENNGTVLRRLLDKVTVDLLPKRINRLQEMIRQLQKSRTSILAKRDQLLKTESKIKAITMKNARICVNQLSSTLLLKLFWNVWVLKIFLTETGIMFSSNAVCFLFCNFPHLS